MHDLTLLAGLSDRISPILRPPLSSCSEGMRRRISRYGYWLDALSDAVLNSLLMENGLCEVVGTSSFTSCSGLLWTNGLSSFWFSP